MKRKRIQRITVALSAASLLLLAACGAQSPETSQPAADAAVSPADMPAPVTTYLSQSAGDNTITVNSNEKVAVVPDIAQVVYAVRTESKEAADCQRKNSESVNKVTQLLKDLGIAEASIQTSDYSMYPVYNYSGNTQRVTGYEATAALTVSDLPIDSLGDILAQSVSNGINNIQSISYSSSKYDAAYQEALKLAVASAQKKAEALAEASGRTLGAVVSIVENSSYSEVRYTDNALSSAMRASGAYEEKAADTADIMPGELDIEVDITVSFSL